MTTKSGNRETGLKEERDYLTNAESKKGSVSDEVTATLTVTIHIPRTKRGQGKLVGAPRFSSMTILVTPEYRPYRAIWRELRSLESQR